MRPCAYPAGVVRLQGRPRPSDPRWQDRPQGFPKHQSQAAALETVERHALRMHMGTPKSEAGALQTKALPATSPRSEAAALQTTARCTFRNVSRHAASHMHTCTCTMHQQGLCGQDFANAMRHQLIGHSMLVRLVQPPHRGAPRKQQPHPG